MVLFRKTDIIHVKCLNSKNRRQTSRNKETLFCRTSGLAVRRGECILELIIIVNNMHRITVLQTSMDTNWPRVPPFSRSIFLKWPVRCSIAASCFPFSVWTPRRNDTIHQLTSTCTLSDYLTPCREVRLGDHPDGCIIIIYPLLRSYR